MYFNFACLISYAINLSTIWTVQSYSCKPIHHQLNLLLHLCQRFYDLLFDWRLIPYSYYQIIIMRRDNVKWRNSASLTNILFNLVRIGSCDGQSLMHPEFKPQPRQSHIHYPLNSSQFISDESSAVMVLTF